MEMKDKYYQVPVTAWVQGYLAAKKSSGELLKDCDIHDLDKAYTAHLRRFAYNELYGDKSKPGVENW